MPSSQKIIDELKKWDVTHVIGLPDNGSAKLYEKLRDEPEIDVITVTREGEAFAIASGLYVGGKQPVALIQNTGFLESGDAIRGTAVNMEIPLVDAYRLSRLSDATPRQPTSPRLRGDVPGTDAQSLGSSLRHHRNR